MQFYMLFRVHAFLKLGCAQPALSGRPFGTAVMPVMPRIMPVTLGCRPIDMFQLVHMLCFNRFTCFKNIINIPVVCFPPFKPHCVDSEWRYDILNVACIISWIASLFKTSFIMNDVRVYYIHSLSAIFLFHEK